MENGMVFHQPIRSSYSLHVCFIFLHVENQSIRFWNRKRFVLVLVQEWFCWCFRFARKMTLSKKVEKPQGAYIKKGRWVRSISRKRKNPSRTSSFLHCLVSTSRRFSPVFDVANAINMKTPHSWNLMASTIDVKRISIWANVVPIFTRQKSNSTLFFSLQIELIWSFISAKL